MFKINGASIGSNTRHTLNIQTLPSVPPHYTKPTAELRLVAKQQKMRAAFYDYFKKD